MKYIAGIASAALFLGAILGTHAAFASSSSYIILSSYYRFPGDGVTVYGYMFEPGESVTVNFGGAAATVRADSSGSFASPVFTVPWSATGGNIPVSAAGVSGDNGSAMLSVGGFYPIVAPSSYDVLPGDSVSFSGSRFGPNEDVLVKRGGDILFRVKADGSGDFSTDPLNVGWSSGKVAYDFVGTASGASFPVTISVRAQKPWIFLSSYYAPRGAEITVWGFAFGSRENVSVAVAGMNTRMVAADGDGNFALRVPVPRGAGNPIQVEARGTSTGGSAAAALSAAL